jgi:hypothetical protein
MLLLDDRHGVHSLDCRKVLLHELHGGVPEVLRRVKVGRQEIVRSVVDVDSLQQPKIN